MSTASPSIGRAAALALLFALVVALSALPAPARAGTIVADNGFRPDPNGFSFANYGNEEGYANLDEGEMQRLFGTKVCFAGRGPTCVLTATAQIWMDAHNQAMGDGHCFGFATLAELIYDGRLHRFGFDSLAAFRKGATVPFQLRIGDVRLQRSIARAWTYQSLPAITDRTIEGAPTRVLDFLRRALSREGEQGWTLLIFQPGYKGGHAITPYAIEDMGGGVFDVHVYDNNWPDNEDRRLTVDTVDDTWSYYAAINPGQPEWQYEGDATTNTLQLMPTRPGLGVQPCAFCVIRKGVGSKYNEIRLDGPADDHAHLLITDAQGRRTGFVGDRLVNRIPGAEVVPRTSAPRVESGGTGQLSDSPEPLYRIPRNIEFKIRVDGRALKRTERETLSLVGPSYAATLPNLIMGPGQVADLRLSPRRDALLYRGSRRTKTPIVAFGAESRSAVYEVAVASLGAPRRAALSFAKNPKRQLMWIGDRTTAKRRYAVQIERTKANGDEASFGRAFTIRGRQRAFLYYGPLSRADGIARVAIVGADGRTVRVLPVRRDAKAAPSRGR
jgi:hypothetical protein